MSTLSTRVPTLLHNNTKVNEGKGDKYAGTGVMYHSTKLSTMLVPFHFTVSAPLCFPTPFFRCTIPFLYLPFFLSYLTILTYTFHSPPNPTPPLASTLITLTSPPHTRISTPSLLPPHCQTNTGLQGGRGGSTGVLAGESYLPRVCGVP